jgi:membrane protein YqaA with SNARE-associated domain
MGGSSMTPDAVPAVASFAIDEGADGIPADQGPHAQPPQPEQGSSATEKQLPGLRLWFAFYVLWLAGLALLAMHGSARLEAGDAGAMGIWSLAVMAFYLSLCNLFLPLPTAWIILLAASPHGGAFGGAWARVLAVTVVGALATAMANVNEYHVLSFLFSYGLGQKLRRTRVYQWAVRWFKQAPFQVLALIGFVPVPIDAIRWLAILQRYSRWRFGLAYFVGRGVRYLLLAGFAVAVSLTTTEILLIQIAIVVVALLVRLVWSRLARRNETQGAP